MAIENAKTLNVRIRNKYDSYENWAASSLVLEAGEIAIAYTSVDVKVDNGTAKHPALLMKVGDGEKTFANLPWLSARAADVVAACKSEEALTTFVNAVIADAGIATDEAMQALAGRVTTVENDLNTAETGLKARVTTAEGAIDALEALVGDTKVADQITAAITALNLADTYAAKTHGHVIADVEGLSDSIAAAKKAGTDANAALEAYKTLNDAAVKVNSDAIAAIKNGETLDNFKEVEEALAGKQAAGDYAAAVHKHEIADVNGLETAIADAKKAGTDASAAAAQALTDAKAYTDSFTGGKTVSDSINTALANYTTTADMNTAIAAAKGEAVAHADGLNTAMNTRVEALEAIDHDHANKAELDLIATGDVTKWNAAEQNAKTYADGLNTAMDARVLALEGKFTGEDSVADQIADAVAAEAELREAADKVLQDQIGVASAEGVEATGLNKRIEELEALVGDDKVSEAIAAAVKVEKERAEGVEGGLETRLKAVEDDYLKAADKTELEGKITANANAIELLTNGVSADEVDGVNDLIQYVKEHGTEVTGIKADIKANADAIAAIPQADWNQNDPAAADYIKNRTHYESGEHTVLFEDDLGNLQDGSMGARYFRRELEFFDSLPDVSELKCEVDGAVYECTKVDDRHYRFVNVLINGKKNDVNIIPYSEANYTNITFDYLYGEDVSGKTFRLLSGEVTIKQLDEKFIPDTIARVADVEADLTAINETITVIDGLVGDKSVSEQITAVTDPLAERVVALEAIEHHDHANKAELDKIAEGDKAKWDAKLEDVTAAADSGLKATRTGNTVAIAIDDSITFVFDCGGAGVSAE